jgi:hypothetical protein
VGTRIIGEVRGFDGSALDARSAFELGSVLVFYAGSKFDATFEFEVRR